MAANGKSRGSKALGRALKEKEWSQRELARRLDISPSTVTRWLNGSRVPDRVHMRDLKRLLKVDTAVWV